MENTKVKEPLFHIVKKDGMPVWKGLLIRVAAIAFVLVVAALFLSTQAEGKNLFSVFSSMVKGAFSTERRRWVFFQNAALLLGTALGLVVAFKMKFWNLGGNGQILVGCLASTLCMYYLTGKVPTIVLQLSMIASAILAGVIWAVIPAIFKAFFRTNESLFTLMMNYIAISLVDCFLNYWNPLHATLDPITGAGVLRINSTPMGKAVPVLAVVALITVFIAVYTKYSKHGYELAIVGESENTARYAGISVKKVVIRTMVLSGAICGTIGLLLSGVVNLNMTSSMDGNMGFTGIMVAWIAKFNPLVMIVVSLFVTFVSTGMGQVCTDFGFTTSDIADIIIGIIYFFIIACEFFINYEIKFNHHKGKGEKKSKKQKFEQKIEKEFADEIKQAAGEQSEQEGK